MMIKKMKRAVVLGLTALVLFAGMPMPKVLAADNAPIHTKVTVSGSTKNQKVNYRLNIDKTKVTDGRITIEYDPEVLTLVNAADIDRFSVSDINTEYKNGDNTGVAYAFTNHKPRAITGQVLALTFTKNAGTEDQDTTIKTTVIALNNEETEVMKGATLEDTFHVGRPRPKTPSGLKLGQTLIAFVPSWKEAANADGYVVYRSDSKDGQYEEIGDTVTTFFYDANVRNNHTYYYKVASYQKNGNERVVSDPSGAVSGTIKKFFGWFH